MLLGGAGRPAEDSFANTSESEGLRRFVRRLRRRGQPPRVIAIADRAQHRLDARYRRLLARGKAHNQVTVAVGRELVGFPWAALDPHRPETT